jgi:hypothetical protein
MHGFYDVPIPVQSPSQCRHLYLQIALFHYLTRPDPAQQLIFRDEIAGRPDQRHQKVEGAATELDGPSIGQQLTSARHGAKSAKPNDRLAV